MSTVGDMVARVQRYASSLSLQRSDILNSLNNALQDLFEEADLEYATGQAGIPAMVTAAGQQTVALPANCVKPATLTWRIGGVLQPVDYAQRDEYLRISQYQAGQQPSPVAGSLKWNLWAGVIWLWPIPAATGTAGQDGELVLDYYGRPPDLVLDADVPGIPVQYHNLLEFYAAADAFALAEEGQWAAYWMDRFNRGKAQMTSERATTQRAAPAKVKAVRW